MKPTCFVVIVAVLSRANGFFTSVLMSGEVLAPFRAGNALKVRTAPSYCKNRISVFAKIANCHPICNCIVTVTAFVVFPASLQIPVCMASIVNALC